MPHALARALPTLHLGEALAWLVTLETASADALITDPPYSSGGMLRSDRTAATRTKYARSDSRTAAADFAGDNRDARSWAYWMTLWLSEAARVVKPGGVCALFTDWRQLPAASDTLQSGGWVQRGIVPWIKPDARHQQGRFAQNAEFLVWGTNGPRPIEGETLPGYYLARSPRATDPGAHQRRHLTQKPLDVMRSIVRIVPEGGLLLDPFVGAGTTLMAAHLEGRRAMGCELSLTHYEAALGRLAQAAGLRSPLACSPALFPIEEPAA
ncbi:DNA-methyltransferase [Streptomyces sp. ISL-111]|uniref:DNA-methyltransferase n=1 Tax=Streptomyces sp. ISL-111 TaxID=2819175 RepID=UPI0027E56EE0|nr:DNA methyltransferase [Streptomyces sp. ISL-111]